MATMRHVFAQRHKPAPPRDARMLASRTVPRLAPSSKPASTSGIQHDFARVPVLSLAQIQLTPDGKDDGRKRKLLQFLEDVSAGKRISFSRGNAELATEILARAKAGEAEFQVTPEVRTRLLSIQNRGAPVGATEPPAQEPVPQPEPPTATEPPIPDDRGGTAESSVRCKDFSYAGGSCDPARPLEFSDFTSVPDGSLKPENARVEWTITAAPRSPRVYQAGVARLEMEETALRDHDEPLLAHERIHFGIACRLVQNGNETVSATPSLTAKVDSFIASLGHELTSAYDSETEHRLKTGGQMRWNDTWCEIVSAAFDRHLAE
jgi:hypothetical protein